MVRRDEAAAEALFTWLGAHPDVEAALERRLPTAATPLLAALADWPEAPEPALRLIDVTVRNVMGLRRIVRQGGWPGLSCVGALGADAAWLIAQHGDAADPLRAGLLLPLEAAVDAGEADPRHLACLADRHAVVRGVPQLYGTVVEAVDGIARFPHPVTRPAALDVRRRRVGLPPLAADLPWIEARGDLIPFGPDRAGCPVLAWPSERA